MNPFLKNIVLELVARNGSAISSFCFVLPSKQSCTFLLRYIEEQWNEHFGRNPVKEEYPEVMTIGDLIEGITGCAAGSRMELLFTMYDAWRSLPDVEQTDFERFRAWGRLWCQTSMRWTCMMSTRRLFSPIWLISTRFRPIISLMNSGASSTAISV